MEVAEVKVPLLENGANQEKEGLLSRTWEELQKQWKIVGPEMIGRLSLYGMWTITISYAGHLGNLELASISISLNVILLLNFGLLLGMASGMETLCGQAYGAKKYHMLGVYLQRSWIVLFLCAILALPVYFYASPLLILFGQPSELANLTGKLCMWFIPLHFSFAALFPLQRFLQCQKKNIINAFGPAIGFAFHVLMTWLFVGKLKYGVTALALSLNASWWVTVFVMFGYVVFGGCPNSWNGFSVDAISGLWEFIKLSAGCGVMICLEMWYYRILILLTGNLRNATIAVDALSICMSIDGWVEMIPTSFIAGTGVRVANELGAGYGKAAKFATVVSVGTTLSIGLLLWSTILVFSGKIALIYTSSPPVLEVVNPLFVLLAFTVLLNSVQPVLSGVAIGSGWQGLVAFINLGSYYLIGVPAGLTLGWIFDFQVVGIWGGMIGGTAVQTIILIVITISCDWDKEAKIAAARLKKWTPTLPKEEEDKVATSTCTSLC